MSKSCALHFHSSWKKLNLKYLLFFNPSGLHWHSFEWAGVTVAVSTFTHHSSKSRKHSNCHRTVWSLSSASLYLHASSLTSSLVEAMASRMTPCTSLLPPRLPVLPTSPRHSRARTRADSGEAELLTWAQERRDINNETEDVYAQPEFRHSDTCCMRPDTVPAVSLGQAEDRAATQRATEWYDCLWTTVASAEDWELWNGPVRDFSNWLRERRMKKRRREGQEKRKCITLLKTTISLLNILLSLVTCVLIFSSHRDFHLTWGLFNNKINKSHDSTLLQDIIKLCLSLLCFQRETSSGRN